MNLKRMADEGKYIRILRKKANISLNFEKREDEGKYIFEF